MTRIVSVLVLAATAAASFVAAPHLPDVMPIHWNAHGVADGFGPKTLALAIMPGVMVALLVIFEAVRRGVPEAARRATDALGLSTTVFMAAVHGMMVAVALGYGVRVERAVPFAISLLFIAMGAFMHDVAPNRFVGIRTPWTMKSPEVWRVTHVFTGRLFVIGGAVLALACAGGVSVWAVLAGFLLLGFVPMGYSLHAWRKVRP